MEKLFFFWQKTRFLKKASSWPNLFQTTWKNRLPELPGPDTPVVVNGREWANINTGRFWLVGPKWAWIRPYSPDAQPCWRKKKHQRREWRSTFFLCQILELVYVLLSFSCSLLGISRGKDRRSRRQRVKSAEWATRCNIKSNEVGGVRVGEGYATMKGRWRYLVEWTN